MTRARMPGRHLVPGRWNANNVAVPDLVPPPTLKRLPPCKPLPKFEQRPSRGRVIAEVCSLVTLLVAVMSAVLLIAARH